MTKLPYALLLALVLFWIPTTSEARVCRNYFEHELHGARADAYFDLKRDIFAWLGVRINGWTPEPIYHVSSCATPGGKGLDAQYFNGHYHIYVSTGFLDRPRGRRTNPVKREVCRILEGIRSGNTIIGAGTTAVHHCRNNFGQIARLQVDRRDPPRRPRFTHPPRRPDVIIVIPPERPRGRWHTHNGRHGRYSHRHIGCRHPHRHQ